MLGLCCFYGVLRAVFSASGLDEIGPQRRYEMAHRGHFAYAPGLFCDFAGFAGCFSASGLDETGPQRRYQTPQWGF